MAYKFPEVKIEVYPRTFLKDVHIGIFFKNVPLSDALKERTKEFFNEEFGLPGIEMEEMPKAASVFSNDEKIRFSFGLGRTDLSIKREAYRSFKDITPLIQKMLGFLSLLDIKAVERLVFSKYNELDYEAHANTAVADVMSGVFSKELIATMTDGDRATQKDLSRWEKLVSMGGEDATSSVFTIEYGFRKQATGKGRNSLTLKTQIESCVDSFPFTNVVSVMREYNQVLDNAFHWCVSEQVINAMRKAE